MNQVLLALKQQLKQIEEKIIDEYKNMGGKL